MLALLATAAVVAGCGKGGAQTVAVVTVTVPAGHTQPPGQPGGSGGSTGGSTGAGSVAHGGASTAQKRAYAEAVNITAQDVPGFSVQPHTKNNENPAEKKLEADLLRCSGGRARGLGELGSPQFGRKAGLVTWNVASGVSFAESPQEAAGELARLRSSRARACLQRYVAGVFANGRFHGLVGTPRVSSGSPPAPGTSGGFAWRVVAPVTVQSVKIPFYIDILGFVYGSSEVTLISSGFPTPLPATAEEQLYTSLIQRALAHGG